MVGFRVHVLTFWGNEWVSRIPRSVTLQYMSCIAVSGQSNVYKRSLILRRKFSTLLGSTLDRERLSAIDGEVVN